MECRLKAKKCGGCPMLGLDYAEQLKQKEAAVRKLVGKYGPVAPIRGAENPCHYRNKVISTFAAGPAGNWCPASMRQVRIKCCPWKAAYCRTKCWTL